MAKNTQPGKVNPEDLLSAVDAMQGITDALTGMRTNLIDAGWSVEAAERIVMMAFEGGIRQGAGANDG